MQDGPMSLAQTVNEIQRLKDKGPLKLYVTDNGLLDQNRAKNRA